MQSIAEIGTTGLPTVLEYCLNPKDGTYHNYRKLLLNAITSNQNIQKISTEEIGVFNTSKPTIKSNRYPSIIDALIYLLSRKESRIIILYPNHQKHHLEEIVNEEIIGKINSMIRLNNINWRASTIPQIKLTLDPNNNQLLLKSN